MGSMAPLGESEGLQHQEKRAEEDAPREELAEMMARLGIDEPAEAAAALLRSWDREESAAAADRFSPAFLSRHRPTDQRAYRPASMVRAAGPAAAPPPPMHPMGMQLQLPPRDARRFAEGRLRGGGGLARGPRNQPGAGMPPPRAAGASAAARGVLPAGDHAYVAPPPPPYLHGVAANRQIEDPSLISPVDEQALLLALSQETADKIVSYACDLLESEHGQRLFHLVLNHCHHQLKGRVVAKITTDRKSFSRLCVQRTDDVVFMINSCEIRRSMLHFRDAIMQWMSPNQMRVLLSDSKRLRVVHAFIVSSPPDIARFIFEAIFENCTRLACQGNGLSLLQNCLERVSWIERDAIFMQLSYQSLHLALNSCGNWIVQDILKKGDSSHLAIIASCLRNHYVALARNKYGSNVVEWCLRVFHEGERVIIINELIYYLHFRDLVTDEFANFTLSTALETCEYPLRNILANAILSQNIILRNQHCTKIFSILAKHGFTQRTALREF